jgi:hypothetical protein
VGVSECGGALVGCNALESADGPRTGFDVAQPRPGHLGLGTMRERADVLGAELSVDAPGDRGNDGDRHR